MKQQKKGMNRRDFLGTACCSVAGTWLGSLGMLQRAHAASSLAKGAGYKALVCIFLDGGADSYNMVVPRVAGTGNPATDYNVYTQSRQNIAVGYNESNNTWSPASLLQLNGTAFGMHPNMGGMRNLFNSNRLAVVANTGTMVQPVSKAQFMAGSVPLPPQLFSHSDQSVQWQKTHADSTLNEGWFGRVADLLNAMNSNPSPSMNISLVGSNVLQVGQTVVPYTIGTGGPIGLSVGWDPGNQRRAVVDAIMATSGHLFEQEHSTIKQRALENYESISGALDALNPLTTAFPQTYIGAQLEMVARMIAIRNTLGFSRQTFVVNAGGWDTHDNQPAGLPVLLQELSDAMTAFYDATVELTVASDVTTFTQSEFSRTLNSNGNGTDHAWGGHQFVMGDAVAGGQIYGTMPNLTIDGPDDIDRGRIVPTLSADQYAATLASWFGVSSGNLDTVFPNLVNFGSNDLGFML